MRRALVPAALGAVVAALGAAASAACSSFDAEPAGPDAPDVTSPPVDAGSIDAPAPPIDDGGRPGPFDGGPRFGRDGGCGGEANCPRIVFVTSEVFTGEDVGGPAGADGRCTLSAARPSAHPDVRGKRFRAWMSSGTVTVGARLTHGTQPYRRPDGQLVANDWTQLTSGPLLNPIDRNENDDPVSGFAWTASTSTGNLAVPDCNGWTIGGANGTVGVVTTTNAWSNGGTQACGTGQRLYCFEE